ncbi:hypothetical protein MYX75_07935 [Acidobacteria bacterium AH-259-A15]|nr:hypothetical protein [Acidobacteria bacterium AH-259-A15]
MAVSYAAVGSPEGTEPPYGASVGVVGNRVWFDKLLDDNWEGFVSQDDDDDFESQWESVE